MESCCIDTEAKDRNCSRTRSCRFGMHPVRTPTPPPFLPHPNENKKIRGKKPRLTLRNKGLTGSQFSTLSKNKAPGPHFSQAAGNCSAGLPARCAEGLLALRAFARSCILGSRAVCG